MTPHIKDPEKSGKTATMVLGGNYFDNTDTKATEQGTVDAASAFVSTLTTRLKKLPGSLGDIGSGLASQIQKLAVNNKAWRDGLYKASLEGGKNIRDLGADALDVFIILADAGWFGGMKIPRELRKKLQKDKNARRTGRSLEG